MFPFSRKRNIAQGQEAVVITQQGIAYVRMQNQSGQTPCCQVCHFVEVIRQQDLPLELKKLVHTFHLGASKVMTTLLDGQASLVMLEKPMVDESELVQAVRWRIKDMLSYSPDDAIMDVFEIPGQQERGRTPLVYVVAAQKSLLTDQVALFDEQEIEIKSIDIPEMVMRNVAALLPEDQNGVALLKLDASQGIITLTQDKSLFLARNIDVGYSSLAPAPQASILGEPAEGLELESGMSPDLQRALDSIVLEVQRSLDYYESHFAKPAITSLVIAPTPYEIPGMLSYFASALGVQVRMLDLNTLVDVTEPMSEELQANAFLALGTALRSDTDVVKNNKSKAA